MAERSAPAGPGRDGRDAVDHDVQASGPRMHLGIPHAAFVLRCQDAHVTDEHDSVGVEDAQLAGTQSGAGEDLEDESVEWVDGGAGDAHQPGGVAVVEDLRQRFGAGWDVAADDRVAGGGVGPASFDDAFEGHAQHPP